MNIKNSIIIAMVTLLFFGCASVSVPEETSGNLPRETKISEDAHKY